MNPSAPHFRGAVLAGGESRRMGKDKALLVVNGEPLWRRQLHLLQSAGADPVTVVRRREQATLAPDVPLLFDTVDNAGPIAGLHAALAACSPGDLGGDFGRGYASAERRVVRNAPLRVHVRSGRRFSK